MIAAGATLDLVAYAAEHRLRVRNLHDGDPCPPVRRTRTGRLGYQSKLDRHNAIICRRGYVDIAGPGRIGVTLLCRTRRALTSTIRNLRAVGVAFRQVGDSEAAGEVAQDALEAVLGAMRVYRRKLTRHGARDNGRFLNASGRGGLRDGSNGILAHNGGG